jgi:hemerythrin-like domain-containing protein
MIGLHQVFRDALAAGPDLIGTVEPRDTERVAFVTNHYINVLRLLHTHHEGEDELLTPRLLQRCPDQADTITRIGNQHEEVLGALGDAETALGAWEADPTEHTRDAAVASIAALEAALTPHLDQEEREILPIAASCINVAEWGELPAHGMQHFDGDKPWLILGLVQDQMTPAQLAGMQAHMPPAQAAFWANTGLGLYRDHQAKLSLRT